MDKKPLYLACLLAIISLAAFHNTLFNDYVYDDIPVVKNNEFIHNVKNIPQFFKSNYWTGAGQDEFGTSFSSGDLLYRPFTVTSLSLTHSITSSSPLGHHAANMALHAFCTLLLFFLLLKMWAPLSAFLGALVFSVHPVHVEAIAPIVGRSELLATLWVLASFLLYCRGYWPIGFLAFLLGLFSKENAAVLPLLLWLYQYLFGEKVIKSSKKSMYVSCLAAILIYALVRMSALSGLISSQQTGLFGETDWKLRIALIFQSFGYYIRLLFLPLWLRPDYTDVFVNSTAPSRLLSISFLSLATITAAIAWGIRLKNRLPGLSFGIFWFFIALLPVSNILPMGNVIAERFLYLPSIGLAIGLCTWLDRFKNQKTTWKFSGIFILAVSGIFVVLTLLRNLDWKDNATLFNKAYKTSPENPTINQVLAKEAFNSGRLEESKNHYLKAIRGNPDFLAAHLGLAQVYRAQKEYELALEVYETAWKLDPDNSYVLTKLGEAYFQRADYASARTIFEKLTAQEPNKSRIFHMLGATYMAMGRPREAAKAYQEVVRLKPESYEDIYNLAVALEESNSQEAKRYWELFFKVTDSLNPKPALVRTVREYLQGKNSIPAGNRAR